MYLRASHFLAIVSGAAFVLLPLLVELVAGDFFLLVPPTLLLAVVALPGLWRSRNMSPAKRVSVLVATASLAVFFAAETYEQTLPQPIPTWVDATPPIAMLVSGFCLVVAGLLRPPTAMNTQQSGHRTLA